MLPKFAKPKLIGDFLKICVKNKYFAATVENNLIRDVEFLNYASNLQANIERQWLFKSKDIENSLNTYNNSDFLEYGENLSLLEKYAIIRKRDRLTRTIPFGLIDIESQSSPPSFGSSSSADTIGILLNNNTKYLNCSYLVNDKQSQEYFYRIQRLRKIWWMKVKYGHFRNCIQKVYFNLLLLLFILFDSMLPIPDAL